MDRADSLPAPMPVYGCGASCAVPHPQRKGSDEAPLGEVDGEHIEIQRAEEAVAVEVVDRVRAGRVAAEVRRAEGQVVGGVDLAIAVGIPEEAEEGDGGG